MERDASTTDARAALQESRQYDKITLVSSINAHWGDRYQKWLPTILLPMRYFYGGRLDKIHEPRYWSPLILRQLRDLSGLMPANIHGAHIRMKKAFVMLYEGQFITEAMLCDILDESLRCANLHADMSPRYNDGGMSTHLWGPDAARTSNRTMPRQQSPTPVDSTSRKRVSTGSIIAEPTDAASKDQRSQSASSPPVTETASVEELLPSRPLLTGSTQCDKGCQCDLEAFTGTQSSYKKVKTRIVTPPAQLALIGGQFDSYRGRVTTSVAHVKHERVLATPTIMNELVIPPPQASNTHGAGASIKIEPCLAEEFLKAWDESDEKCTSTSREQAAVPSTNDDTFEPGKHEGPAAAPSGLQYWAEVRQIIQRLYSDCIDSFPSTQHDLIEMLVEQHKRLSDAAARSKAVEEDARCEYCWR